MPKRTHSHIKKPLIAIVGPTASGKTDLAVALASKFNGEIISADSRQVYIGMDIGTGKEGKPATADLPGLGKQSVRTISGVPQYLVDLVPPTQYFNVANFQSLAYKIIDNILERNKLPLLVGGTNLYVAAVTEGYVLPPSCEKELALRAELDKLSDEELLYRLKTSDPASYENIDHRNRRRIIRALSATLFTKSPISQLKTKTPPPYDVLYIGLSMPREELYKKIDERVDIRLRQGMIDEVKGLLAKGVPAKRLISFGLEYRYITLYLTGEIASEKEMAEQLKFATHAFARRQLTWLRRRFPVTWVSSEDEAISAIERFLGK